MKKKSIPNNTKSRSVGFDDKNQVHEFELEEGEKLNKSKYPTKKSADANIPLEKTLSPILSPQEELAQFKRKFEEQSSRIYMVDYMAKRDQESLRTEADGKTFLHDMVSKEEGNYDALPIKNQDNVEFLLEEGSLEAMLTSTLDKEFNKLKNKEIAQTYYDEKKANMKNHIKEMDKTLKPRINDIIKKAEENNPIDELYDSNEKIENKKKAITQEVYNEFDKLTSKEKKKKSVKFADKDTIREYEAETIRFRHYPNPRGMNHEDKSSRAVIDTENLVHEPADPDVALENFLTNFVKRMSREIIGAGTDEENKIPLSDVFENVLNEEYAKVPKANKKMIQSYYDEMLKHKKECIENLTKKTDKLLKETGHEFSSEQLEKVFKPMSASFYEKLSKLCTSCCLKESGAYYMKKSREIKIQAMKKTLKLTEVNSSNTAKAPAVKALGQIR